MKPTPDKAAILARVAGTRAILVEDLSGLGSALDLPGRLRSSFQLHPAAWIAGALALGVTASSLFRRNGREGGIARWRPMILGAFGFLGNRLLTLSLPTLTELIESEVTRWIDRRQHTPKEPTSNQG